MDSSEINSVRFKKLRLRELRLWKPKLREPRLRKPRLREPRLRQPSLRKLRFPIHGITVIYKMKTFNTIMSFKVTYAFII